MIFAKKSLPFIYSDTFIAIAIVIMVLLAVISFVLIPLFVLKKSPNRKVKIKIDQEGKLLLDEELAKYFSSVTVKDRIISFIRLPGIEKVRVAIYFPSLVINNVLIYDLDFNEGDNLRVAFPNRSHKVKDIFLVDDHSRDMKGQPVASLKRSRLWIFSITSGLTLAACIFLIVLILSTHLREVRPSFIGYYFFALFGGALIPAIYFMTRFISKKLESRGK